MEQEGRYHRGSWHKGIEREVVPKWLNDSVNEESASVGKKHCVSLEENVGARLTVEVSIGPTVLPNFSVRSGRMIPKVLTIAFIHRKMEKTT